MSAPVGDVVLDVEGTTSSIHFVHEVLFPYARERLGRFVTAHREDPSVAAELDRARESLSAAGLPAATDAEIIAGLERYIDEDVKDAALKNLQGLIWREGFESKAFVAHVYPEVPAALERWSRAGWRLSIYSSGSVQAQRLFFAHTEAGDLGRLLHAHFDTLNAGPKRESASYLEIQKRLGSGAMVFLSDIEAELDAAQEAGWQVAQIVRPGTAPSGRHRHFPDLDAAGSGLGIGQ